MAATRFPARATSARMVGARRYLTSFINTSEPFSSSKKKLPHIPWTEGGAPVTIERLFGFVKEGMTESPVRTVPKEVRSARKGALPTEIAWLMYSCSHPSMQTTIVGFDGNRYVLLLTVIEVFMVIPFRNRLKSEYSEHQSRTSGMFYCLFAIGYIHITSPTREHRQLRDLGRWPQNRDGSWPANCDNHQP